MDIRSTNRWLGFSMHELITLRICITSVSDFRSDDMKPLAEDIYREIQRRSCSEGGMMNELAGQGGGEAET